MSTENKEEEKETKLDETRVANAQEAEVPVAKDGSYFGRHLGERGYYQVGAKGEEQKYELYEEALAELRKMTTARWRRPNDKGHWGIVTAVKWQVID